MRTAISAPPSASRSDRGRRFGARNRSPRIDSPNSGNMSAVKRLSRRTLLTAGASAAALAAFDRGSAAETKPHSRSNILWLVSEDNYPFIGAYGDRLAHTPAIDAL